MTDAMLLYLGGLITLVWSDALWQDGRARLRQWRTWVGFFLWPVVMLVSTCGFLWWCYFTGSARGFSASAFDTLINGQIRNFERRARRRFE